MRGTGYAVAEIMFWMLAAAAVGMAIGWVLRTWSARRQATSEWATHLDAERARVDELEAEVEELSAALGHRHQHGDHPPAPWG